MVTALVSLHNVVQGDAETLRKYMAQFVEAFIHIPNLKPLVVVHTLLVGGFLDTLFNCETQYMISAS